MTGISPLQLKNSVFTDIKITAQADAQNGALLLASCEFGLMPITENKRTWQVSLTVNLKNANEKIKTSYLGTVQCVGIFDVAAEFPEESIEKLVFVNGTGLLYSIIREMICNITARGPYPMVTLVTQSFLDTYEKRGKTTPATVELSTTGTITN